MDREIAITMIVMTYVFGVILSPLWMMGNRPELEDKELVALGFVWPLILVKVCIADVLPWLLVGLWKDIGSGMRKMDDPDRGEDV